MFLPGRKPGKHGSMSTRFIRHGNTREGIIGAERFIYHCIRIHPAIHHHAVKHSLCIYIFSPCHVIFPTGSDLLDIRCGLIPYRIYDTAAILPYKYLMVIPYPCVNYAYKYACSAKCQERLLPHLGNSCRPHSTIILCAVHYRKRRVSEIFIIYVSKLIPVNVDYSPPVINSAHTEISISGFPRIKFIRAPVQDVCIIIIRKILCTTIQYSALGFF